MLYHNARNTLAGGKVRPDKERILRVQNRVTDRNTREAYGAMSRNILPRNRYLKMNERVGRLATRSNDHSILRRLTTRIPQSRGSLMYRGIRTAAQKTASMPGKALGSAFDFVAKRPKLMGGMIGAGVVGAVGFGISYGVAAMGRARNKAPVVHTGAIRNTGQTNQYFNLGQDPFAGVRFASRKR